MYNFYPESWGNGRSRHVVQKFLLIMKITMLILVTVILHVSASSFAQKVSISAKNAPLAVIFETVHDQTGYDFLFTGSDLKKAKPISIQVKNADLQEVLKEIFADQPLNYVIENKSVVISLKDESSLHKFADQAPRTLKIPAEISGTVTDTLGRPLIGASVTLKELKLTTQTDVKGYFSFPNVPQGEYRLLVSYVGYAKSETAINNKGRDLQIPIVLRLLSSQLDQVQVIAYGTESKRFSIGSVATVNAEVISKQPVTNPLLALQGQVPGLAVNATNGVPGSTALIQVRGQNTLGSTLQVKPYDQPLFIIDGVPFAPQNVNINQLNNLATAQSYNGGISQATGISPFNSINPNDIESITILKDAGATSIYGSQGANGVVLITTKKGKAGKTSFDLNLNTQFNAAARPVKLLNTQQYLSLRKEAFAADGLTPSDDPFDEGYAPDLTVFDQNKYTDWQKIIGGRTTNNTDLHATVSGGNENNTFLVAGGYTRSNYNYPGDFADQRLTLHSALHNNSSDKRFSLDLVTDYGYDQNRSSGYGGTQGVVLPPNLPDLLDPSGNLVWNYNGVPLNVQNFYSFLRQPTELSNFNFNSSLNVSYKILKNLQIGANVGYSRQSIKEHSENPASAQDPSYAQASAAFANNNPQTINIEPQINYNKSFGKSTVTALLGGTYRKTTNDAYRVEAYGYSNDNFLGSVIGATETYPTEDINVFKYSAAFVRLKYMYDQKYILELSGRRDGSSNFGPGRQFGNFGSIGAGWIFSEEKALQETLPFISYGKLSGSYGTTGGDASRAYSYQALYQNSSSVPPFQDIRQAFPYNLYNPNFSWASKKSLNVGLDLGFLKNRILLNATFYRNREGNQLVDMPLPIQTGFTRVFGNLNALVQNKGWEFSATSTNISNRDFTWTTNFNLTFNRNKLLDFPNLAASAYANKYIVGQSTSIIIGYRYKGVNPETGIYEFYDKDGNVTSSPKSGLAANGGDQGPIGNLEVKFMGGFGNTFSYKRFSLYVFCQFSSGNALNYLAGLYSTDFPGAFANQPVNILGQYWQKPGDRATIQKLSGSYFSSTLQTIPPFTQSDGIYSRDTYLRVKTASLSYTLPEDFLQRIHIRSGTVYVNAQNLFTLTNYKGGDPEQPGVYTAFPLQKVIAFGLNFKF